MELKFSSPKNVPYIEFDEVNKLIFASALEHKTKGFNYVCFSGIVGTKISLSKRNTKSKKKPKTLEIRDRINFISDVHLSSIPKEAMSVLTPVTLNFLRKCFNDYSEGDYIARDKLQSIADCLERTNGIDEDTWDEDPDITWDGTWDDED
jgi:hypothetical protein